MKIQNKPATSDSRDNNSLQRLILIAGNFLFRHRSYTPIPLALVVIWQAETTFPLFPAGLALIAVGELIRMAALRSVGVTTRTRRVGARRLVTWGLYSLTRNPLYIGNLLLWSGALLFAGGRYFLLLFAIMLVLFLIQYALIVALEEARLEELFGESYSAYCQAVPRVIPRSFKTAANPDQGAVYPWRSVLRSERSTLIVIGGVTVLSLISTLLKA